MDVGFKQIWCFLFPTHLKNKYATIKWDHFPKYIVYRVDFFQTIELPPPWIWWCFFRLMRFTRFNHSTLGRSPHLWTVRLVTSWWLLWWSWRNFNGKPSQQTKTPWMFKKATENIPSQKETSIPPIIFQGLCSGVYYEKIQLNSVRDLSQENKTYKGLDTQLGLLQGHEYFACPESMIELSSMYWNELDVTLPPRNITWNASFYICLFDPLQQIFIHILRRRQIHVYAHIDKYIILYTPSNAFCNWTSSMTAICSNSKPTSVGAPRGR